MNVRHTQGAQPCCPRPCLVPTWEGKRYGNRCLNCRTFTAS